MFKRRSFSETARLLCEGRKEFLRANGSLNVRRAANYIGMNQETLKRILDGQSASPSASTADKMTRYFKISRDQLVGVAPIPWVDLETGDDEKARKIAELLRIAADGDEDLVENILRYAQFVTKDEKKL